MTKAPLSVLIIDDEPLTIRSLTAVLKRTVPIVDGVESSVEALEKLRIKIYDLLFVDLHMPYLDGLSFVAQLRNLEIFTPVILFSGYITPDITLQAYQLGVIDLIAKPPTAAIIQQTMEDVLQRFSPEERDDTSSLNHAKRLIHQRKFSEAKAMLEQLVQEQEGTDASILLAITYEVLGDFSEAEATYKKTLKNAYANETPLLSTGRREWLEV